MTQKDLTRWNRAGLEKIQYVEGNAASFLERLREDLYKSFSEWSNVAPDEQVSNPTLDDQLKWLKAQYNKNPDDILWHLLRSFTRCGHVLTETVNAYANEAHLRTATQWDNVRKLVSMLNYYPAPPASAYTPIVIFANNGRRGTLDKGFKLQYLAERKPPVIFETLQNIGINEEINEIRAREYNRSQKELSGNKLILEGVHKKLQTGTPLVIEVFDEKDNSIDYFAHTIKQQSIDECTTTVLISPGTTQKTRGRKITHGHVRIHLMPKEMLRPLGPVMVPKPLDKSIRLDSNVDGILNPRDVLIVRDKNNYGEFLYVNSVNSNTITVHKKPNLAGKLEEIRLFRTQAVTIAPFGNNEWKVAGKWDWLAGVSVSEITSNPKHGGTDFVIYRVKKAKYHSYDKDKDEKGNKLAGFTTITLGDARPFPVYINKYPVWRMRISFLFVNIRYFLSYAYMPVIQYPNDKTVYVPLEPENRISALDGFSLERSLDIQRIKLKKSFEIPLSTSAAKKATEGDFAVIQRKNQLAWMKIHKAENNTKSGESLLFGKTYSGSHLREGRTNKPVLKLADRGGAPFFLEDTKVYTDFSETVRLEHWNINNSPIRGYDIPTNHGLMTLLQSGRKVIIDNGKSSMVTKIMEVRGGVRPHIKVADTISEHSTFGNIKVYGNVVMSGHGESSKKAIFGNGDATVSNLSITVKSDRVSFITDARQNNGVRADIQVKVDDRIWSQVPFLRYSSNTDHHYTIRMNEDGYIDVIFGDGIKGRRTPTGLNNIRISYREGVGSDGNLEHKSLSSPVHKHPLVKSIYQPLPAGGGGEAMEATEIKKLAPSSVLTLGRAVSLKDFEILAMNHSSVWQAKAFKHRVPGRKGNVVEVIVALSKGNLLTQEISSALKKYLQINGVPNTTIKVAGYEPVYLLLNIRIQVRSDIFDPAVVLEQCERALLNEFSLRQRQLGQTLHRGEIYKVVESVTGVENADCQFRISQKTQYPVSLNQSEGKSILAIPSEQQCIHLDANEPKLQLSSEEFHL